MIKEAGKKNRQAKDSSEKPQKGPRTKSLFQKKICEKKKEEGSAPKTKAGLSKTLLLGLGLIAAMLSAGCSHAADASALEKIHTKLLDMKAYKSEGSLVRFSNKGEEVYEIAQYWQEPNKYRLELKAPLGVAGNYTVYDGERIAQYNPSVSPTPVVDVPDSPHRNQIFLNAFIKNYFKSEETAAVSSSLDESKCTVLEAVIPGENQYLATQKLWIENETLLPERLVIYDNKGKERYILDYTSFEYDPILNIDGKLFKTK